MSPVYVSRSHVIHTSVQSARQCCGIFFFFDVALPSIMVCSLARWSARSTAYGSRRRLCVWSVFLVCPQVSARSVRSNQRHPTTTTSRLCRCPTVTFQKTMAHLHTCARAWGTASTRVSLNEPRGCNYDRGPKDNHSQRNSIYLHPLSHHFCLCRLINCVSKFNVNLFTLALTSSREYTMLIIK